MRTNIEIAATQTRTKHQVNEEKPAVPDGESAR